MAQYNVPWTLRRFIPWYKHDYKQTSFDRQFYNTSPSTIESMLSAAAVEYDHANLKGDGVPNLKRGKNFHLDNPADGKAPGTQSSSSKTVSGGDGIHTPERPSWNGLEYPRSRSGNASPTPDPWGPGTWGSRFKNRPPTRFPGSRGSIWGDGGGRGHGSRGSGSGGRPSKPRSAAPTPPPAVAGTCPPPESPHRGSRGPRSVLAVPGSGDASRSLDSRAATRSSHHTAPGSHRSQPPPSLAGSRASRRGQPDCPPDAGSSHHSVTGSRNSVPGSRQSAAPPPPPSATGSPSQHSRAGSGSGVLRQGPGGSIKVNSRGMTWKDV